jgi:VIT1/CCC1 family predicted Fe2+/Mn2+ transporter
LLSKLQQERDQLVAMVASLRGFESDYRSKLADHLQQQLQTLQRLRLEPEGPAGQATPRLDALLNEGRGPQDQR